MTNDSLVLKEIHRSYRIIALTFLAAIAFMVAGCGGHDNSGSPAPTQTTGAISGNFNLSVLSQTRPGTSFVGGPLQTDSSRHATGLVHAVGSALSCFGLVSDLLFSATIDSTGFLSGTITSTNGQAITINGQVSSDGASISSGLYTASATGCFAGDHGTFTGFQMQPFTGTYSGTFGLSPGISIALTIPLTQPTTPDSHGFFEFAPSTVTVTGGSACGMASASFAPIISLGWGGSIGIELIGSDGVTRASLVGFTGTGSTTSLNALLIFISGPCSAQQSLGILTR
jgi:hypothetical protein